jgi:hypothetical protein
MIKKEIISYVKGFLPREDKTQRYHSRFVEAVCEKVIVEMYNDLFKINPLLLDKYTKQYGVTTPIAISLESSSGLYYSTLPVQVVSLPDRASGVRHIYPVTQSGNQFVPMDAREADIISNTDVAIVTSKIGYRVRQDTRVDYYNTNAVIRSAGVRMDLLIPFSIYADTDVVLIPELTNSDAPSSRYGSKQPAATFIERVLGLLGVVPPAELADTNAPPDTKQNSK